MNDIDEPLQQACDNIEDLNSKFEISNTEILATECLDNNPCNEFDISKLNTEVIYIPKKDKFHNWLSIIKCNKCWNQYAFYEIDYLKGPWALYCPSSDHRWSEYICSDCYVKSVHFRKNCKMQVVRFVREK